MSDIYYIGLSSSELVTLVEALYRTTVDGDNNPLIVKLMDQSIVFSEEEISFLRERILITNRASLANKLRGLLTSTTPAYCAGSIPQPLPLPKRVIRS